MHQLALEISKRAVTYCASLSAVHRSRRSSISLLALKRLHDMSCLVQGVCGLIQRLEYQSDMQVPLCRKKLCQLKTALTIFSKNDANSRRYSRQGVRIALDISVLCLCQDCARISTAAEAATV